jgi:glycosyltransferase involved in cell wall biosynthesis
MHSAMQSDLPSAPPITVSVVVPVYSGADYLVAVIAEIERVRTGWTDSGAPLRLVEAILVDDAAVDSSPELAERLAREKEWVTVLHLARNFGQHPATIAGILHTSGDWIITLDEDLQHHPARIEDMLRIAVRNGHDIVYASPHSPVHQSHMRDFGSRLYKRLMQSITGNTQIATFNSFRLVRGSIARAAASVCGHDTYFDVSLSWFTQRVTALPMDLKDQRYIRTKSSGYNFSGLVSHARRMMMSSGARVMRAASLLGLLFVGISVMGGLGLVLYHLYEPTSVLVRGWASLILAIVFCSGFIILLLGIVLEYIALLVLHAHGKPIFFIADRHSDAILVDYFAKRHP